MRLIESAILHLFSTKFKIEFPQSYADFLYPISPLLDGAFSADGGGWLLSA